MSPALSPAQVPNLTQNAVHHCTCCQREYVIGEGIVFLGSIWVEDIPWFRFIPYCSDACLIAHYPPQGTC